MLSWLSLYLGVTSRSVSLSLSLSLSLSFSLVSKILSCNFITNGRGGGGSYRQSSTWSQSGNIFKQWFSTILRGLNQAQSLERLTQAFGDLAPSRTTVFNWFAEFKRGRTSFEDEERSGSPSTAVTEDKHLWCREDGARGCPCDWYGHWGIPKSAFTHTGFAGAGCNVIKWSLSHVVRSARNAGAGSDIRKCSRRWSRHAGGRNDHWLVGYNVS